MTTPAADTPRPSSADHLRTLSWFAGLLWRAAPFALTVNIVGMVLQALVPAAQLVVFGRLVDSVHAIFGQGEAGFTQVLPWLALLAGLQLAQAGLGALRGHARAIFRERTGWRLQELVIARASTVPLSQFEQPGFFDRMQRAQWAAIWRSFMIFESALSMVEFAITLLSFLGLLMAAHWSIPFILLAGVAPVLLAYLRRGRETYGLHREQTTQQRRADYLVQLLTDREAAKEVRLYDLGPHLVSTWTHLAQLLRRERFRLTLRQQKHLGIAQLASVLSLLGALLVLLWQAVATAITLGAFFALTETAGRFQAQLQQVLGGIGQVFEQMLYLSDLRDFTTLDPERQPDQQALPDRPLAIVCQDVSFAYPGGEPVLQNLNFALAPGEKLALVGENGAGKTTLIKLLLGLYHPTQGRVLIDGIDSRQLDLQSLRQRCAAVFQDFLQYQLSAGENIGFGRIEDIEDQPRIEAAASAGGAAGLVASLTDQYRTVLGRYFSGGQDLSRGQWQKLALARAYFRGAQFLVFDEPTAALDPRAELEVFAQFRDLAQGRSAVFVSHRMASARVADRILVLGQGHLLEDGTHRQLLEKGGEYARMFGLQARWYQDDLPQPEEGRA
ncbi:MAG: ATP-binding cassette domain-containing protein [Candidatus Latescibacteria bacterium]|nr:ATP-binding cassette domain-containing protein [Candidatus Latescibacterota bacterium]